ncbi:hypothetical protein QYF36_018021 [Acer negundo]|nr:hypothetical protein QYF36_018021 [Acer negundo]
MGKGRRGKRAGYLEEADEFVHRKKYKKKKSEGVSSDSGTKVVLNNTEAEIQTASEDANRGQMLEDQMGLHVRNSIGPDFAKMVTHYGFSSAAGDSSKLKLSTDLSLPAHRHQ